MQFDLDLPLEYTNAKDHPKRDGRRSRTVREWDGGALDLATEPILDYYCFITIVSMVSSPRHFRLSATFLTHQAGAAISAAAMRSSLTQWV